MLLPGVLRDAGLLGGSRSSSADTVGLLVALQSAAVLEIVHSAAGLVTHRAIFIICIHSIANIVGIFHF